MMAATSLGVTPSRVLSRPVTGPVTIDPQKRDVRDVCKEDNIASLDNDVCELHLP